MKQRIAAIGGYGKEDKDNVFVYQTEDNGQWKCLASLKAGIRPSYLCFGKNGLLYVVNEQNQAMHAREGLVKTFRLSLEGTSLEEIGSISSLGEDPCFLVLDPTGKFLLTTNYTSGTVAIFPLCEEGIPKKAVQTLQFFGSGPNKARQAWSHPHSILFDEGRSCFYVADLGTDRLHQYSWNPANLEPAHFIKDLRLEAGSGPRLMRLSSDQQFMYVVRELDNSISKVNLETGESEYFCTTVQNPGWESTAAHLELQKDAIIVSTRGEDTLLVHTQRGDTWYDCKGKCPRFFAVEGDCLYVANQESDSIVRFTINEDCSLSEGQVVLDVPNPTCLQFKP
jgi:6-phosphogluconolactonase